MNEYELVRQWRERNNVYATIDRNPSGVNQIILCKGNVSMIRKLDSPVTNELLDKLLEEFNIEKI